MSVVTVREFEYSYLPAVDLREVESDRAILLDESTVLGQIMPMDYAAGDSVVWDMKDVVTGMLPSKIVGEPYPLINPRGGRRRAVPASHYGATMPVDVKRVVSGAALGTLGDKISIDALVGETQEELAFKEKQLKDYMRGRLLCRGIIEQLDKNMNVLDTWYQDSYNDNYVALSGGDLFTAGATATPISLARKLGASTYLGGTGYSALGAGPNNWMSGAVILMSPMTASAMLNTAEVKTIRNAFGASVTSVDELNEKLVTPSAGIPTFVVVDSPVFYPNGDYAQAIEDGFWVVIGRHNTRGARCGTWTVSSNENLGGLPEIFAMTDLMPVHPKLPQTTRSIAGAPTLHSDKQVIRIQVADPALIKAGGWL